MHTPTVGWRSSTLPPSSASCSLLSRSQQQDLHPPLPDIKSCPGALSQHPCATRRPAWLPTGGALTDPTNTHTERSAYQTAQGVHVRNSCLMCAGAAVLLMRAQHTRMPCHTLAESPGAVSAHDRQQGRVSVCVCAQGLQRNTCPHACPVKRAINTA